METRIVLKDKAKMLRVNCSLKANSEFPLQLNWLKKKKKKAFLVLIVGCDAEFTMFNGTGMQ